MQASSIPAKFPIPFANNAGAGYIRSIPVASQIGITNGAASLTDGFVPLNFLPVGSGGVPPFGQDFNGLLNEITSWNRWAQAGGPVGYDSAFSTAIGGYPKGAIIAAATAGNFWLCTVDNNTSDPDTAGAGWTGFQLLTPAIIASITPAESSLWYIGTASAGTSTAITTTLMPSPVTSSSIRAMRVPITTTNGPSATLNFGFSPVPIVINTTGAAVTGGEMPGGIGFEADFEYDGTYARLMNPVNATGPNYVGSATGGTATALTTTLTNPPATLTTGMQFRCPITTTVGATATINFGFGVKSIVSNTTGTALVGGEATGGESFEAIFVWDGTYVRLMNSIPNPISPQSPKAWVSWNTNSSGTVTIIGSYNVSSVVRTSQGFFTINFATTLPTSDLVIVGLTSTVTSGEGPVDTDGTYMCVNTFGTNNSTQVSVTMSIPSTSGGYDPYYSSVLVTSN